jgi:hypothetical protein
MKKLILLAIILLLPTATYAFTDNSSAPPANNTPLPLNTSSTAQTKVGPLISNSYMQADVFYDRYNSGYYLQPRGTNRLNYIVANNTLTTGNSITNGEVQGAFFRDRNDGNFYVDPNNTSRVNSVLANNLRSLTDIRAPRFIDENNTGLYIDPSSSSFITDIYANRMYDRNNSFFYTDPNTTSVMHSINTYLFRDLNDGNFYVDPNGWSLLRNLQADIVYDRNNTGYYIDPAGTSRMNYVVFNNTYTYGNGNYNDVFIRSAGRWASQINRVRGYCIECRGRDDLGCNDGWGGRCPNVQCANFGNWTNWSRQRNHHKYEDYCRILIY